MEELVRRKICELYVKELCKHKQKHPWLYVELVLEECLQWYEDIKIDDDNEIVWLSRNILKARNLINPFYKDIEYSLEWQLVDNPKKYWFKILNWTRLIIDDVNDEEFYYKYLTFQDYIRGRGGAFYRQTSFIYNLIKQILCKKLN